MKDLLSPLHNGAAIPLAKLPLADNDRFFQGVLDAITGGWRVSSYFGVPKDSSAELFCVLTSKADGTIGVARTSVEDSFPSLAEILSSTASV